MGDSVEWLELKLGKLEGMMKTDVGRQMAKVRTERLWAFSGWWNDEIGVGKVGERALGVYTEDKVIKGGLKALKIGEE